MRLRGILAIGALVLLATVPAPAAGAAGGGDDDDRPVTAVTFNHLHGLFCAPEETDWCNAPARVEVFGRWLERTGCPDLVGLQEINPRLDELLSELVATVCDGEYEIAWQPANEIDAQMVLTRLEVLEQGHLDIANFPWEAYWVRVESPQGPVDFLTAHFASSSNDPPCTAENCPPVCAAGISTNECHAHEVVDFLAARSGAAVTIVAGDLNATRDDPTLDALIGAGYVDTWLEAGRKECDPVTGTGCTGCREQPGPLIGLDTAKGLDCRSRIDFVLARPGDDCDLTAEARGFAHRPLRRAVDGLYWASDHRGALASLRCA